MRAARGVVIVEGDTLALPDRLAALRQNRDIVLRVPVRSFDPTVQARAGAAHPRAILRGIIAATSAGAQVEALLPIEAGLGAAAGRIHGLSRVAPHIARFVLAPSLDVPDRELEREIEEAREVARELGVLVELADEARVDTQLEALRSGLKPAVRLTTSRADLGAMLERYSTLGLATVVGAAPYIDSSCTATDNVAIVYVAPTREVAERVAAIEAEILGRPARHPRRASATIELGLALGYPKCCVVAFVDVLVRSEIRHRNPYPADDYVTACAARTERPDARLNDLLFDVGPAPLSFTPCNYACAAAGNYAAAVLARLAEVAPLTVEPMRARLAVDVAIDAFAARAIVRIEGDRIVFARPRRGRDFRLIDRRDVALSERIVGASVRPDGMIAADPHAAIVVRFSEGAR